MLAVCLITLGDPATLTGGYRYHRRMAELAGRYNARMVFVSLPTRLSFLYGWRAATWEQSARQFFAALGGQP